DMGEDRTVMATKVKESLREHVLAGRVFCPLSTGLIVELYRQSEEARFRIGALMEEFSLNVSYANPEEIFEWEIRQAICKLAEIGPADFSSRELYVPVAEYLSSRMSLEFFKAVTPSDMTAMAAELSRRIEAIRLTEILAMRTQSNDKIFEYAKKLPAPAYAERVRQSLAAARGDKAKLERREVEFVVKRYVSRALEDLPLPAKIQAANYFRDAPKDKYGGCVEKLIELAPSVRNHIELMVTLSQFPTRNDKINHFFDNELMPVSLAYATAFASRDGGIRDVLKHRTRILSRSDCSYCENVEELGTWLGSVAVSNTSESPAET
ncbi:MAG TPA: hypothetical protein VGE52_04170, partial [Pirellulales bacterium]